MALLAVFAGVMFLSSYQMIQGAQKVPLRQQMYKDAPDPLSQDFRAWNHDLNKSQQSMIADLCQGGTRPGVQWSTSPAVGDYGLSAMILASDGSNNNGHTVYRVPPSLRGTGGPIETFRPTY